jgi:hypothetical protein
MSGTAAKVQVFSCGCIVRRYDGKMVVVNKTCTYHRVHPDMEGSALQALCSPRYLYRPTRNRVKAASYTDWPRL